MFSACAVQAVSPLSLEIGPLFLNSSDVHCRPRVNRVLLNLYEGEKDMSFYYLVKQLQGQFED
jgi:hypothetical protein